MYSSNLLKSDLALTTGKHTQTTKENSKGMEDLNASNVSHISIKPSQCIYITAKYTGTFRNNYNACDMFSNRTRLPAGLFNGEESNVLF